MIVMIRV